MKSPRLFLFFFLLVNSQLVFSQISQNIRGKVVENTSKQPIEKVSVIIENANLQTITNSYGEFVFENVPTGRYTLSVSCLGFTKRKISELLLQSGKELVLEIELTTSTSNLEELTITAASPNLSGALTSITNITTEQVMRYPASFMDPARLAQSYAGVTTTNDQANGISVRGNNPNTLQWRLEGVEIVNPNHTSNAGTFGDLPTAAGGGVNILSAQLLGNMNFLTGAFPAEYGNVLGGVMDMRLRKGNDKKHEFTAQVGFIGVDLAAEGPFSKKSKASYLINYRYSFTGLLGLGGIDFGGEAISFQDLSFNISIPTKKLGDFTVFGMGGKSANVFTSPDKAEWQEQKDQFNIDFRSKMGSVGITHEKSFRKVLWKNVFAFSGTDNNRLQESVFGNASNSISSNYLSKLLASANSFLQHKIGAKHSVKYGAYMTFQRDGILNYTSQKVFNYGLIAQPYVNLTLKPTEKLISNLGVHYIKNIFETESGSLEPRLSLAYQLNAKNSFAIAYGLHSQLQLNQAFLLSTPSLSKSHHFVLNHQLGLSESLTFKTELFYQRLFNVPTVALISNSLLPYASLLNVIDEFPSQQYLNSGFGTNYGVEFSIQKYLTKGYFLLSNISLFKSTVEVNNQSYDSRFNNRHVFNLTAGKEWKKTNNRIWGVNGRLVWMGGMPDTPINLVASKREKTTVYENSVPFTIQQADYIRPDVRVYFRKSKENYARMLSIDIQNVANIQNVAYSYYDNFLEKVVTKYQLGLIPMLNYRWEF